MLQHEQIVCDASAGTKRPKLALLSAVRQRSTAATKQALSSLHDQGAPEVPDLDPAQPAAPSTLASELSMATPEEGECLIKNRMTLWA